MNENEMKWISTISKTLVGMTITGVRYMTEMEREDLGWFHRAIVITAIRKDGKRILLWPSQDDEGNDAGALFTTDEKLPTIPVF